MELQNQNKKIFLTNSPVELTNNVSTSAIISDMLLKYGLKETEEELTQKMFGSEKGESNGGTILWTALRLFNGEKSEKDALFIFTERLHISMEKAEQIINDIKKNIFPVLKNERGKEKEINNSNNLSTSPVPIYKPTNKMVKTQQEKESAKKNIENVSAKEKTVKKQSDTYREPIE